MMDLKVFEYDEDHEVRAVEKDGETWWVLKDVCKVLNLSTPARVSERLEEDEVSQTHFIDSMGRKQEMTIINESGLYSVILRSDKPEAKPFKRWVTHKVLPSIRKTGAYMAKGYQQKSSSLGEFVKLMKETRIIMERAGAQYTDIAQTVYEMGKQFHVTFPDKFASYTPTTTVTITTTMEVPGQTIF